MNPREDMAEILNANPDVDGREAMLPEAAEKVRAIQDAVVNGNGNALKELLGGDPLRGQDIER